MSEKEARFLVDAYHIIQEDRKRFKNQTTAMGGEPHAILPWFFQQNQALEKQRAEDAVLTHREIVHEIAQQRKLLLRQDI